MVKFPGYRTTWTVDLNKHDVRVREQEQEQEHGQEQEQEGDLVNLAAYDMPLAQSKQQLRAVQRRAEQLMVEQCAPPPPCLSPLRPYVAPLNKDTLHT